MVGVPPQRTLGGDSAGVGVGGHLLLSVGRCFGTARGEYLLHGLFGRGEREPPGPAKEAFAFRVL